MSSLPTKVCRACGLEKPLTEFSRNHQTEDQLMYDCKVCYLARHGKALRIRREPDPEGFKTCTSCGEMKPQTTEFFHRDIAHRDGLANWCKPCLIAAQTRRRNRRPDLKREADKRRYAKGAEQMKEDARLSRRERTARNRQWVDDYLAAHPCVDCGESDTRCLHFDHRNDEEKQANVAHLLSKAATLVRIEEEVARCDIRCANCHLKRHNRNRWTAYMGYTGTRTQILNESQL